MTHRGLCSIALTLAITLIIPHADAGILALNSRIIYPQDSKAQTLVLKNLNQYPIMMQTWVDDGLADPDKAKAPFVVLPAVFKMQPQGIHTLRIVHNGETMPQDRESVYWLNLYEIPGKTQPQTRPLATHEARLALTMNTLLKIFYRPKTLKNMDTLQIAKQLQFSLQQQQGKTLLMCHNPTAYHVSFTGLSVQYAATEIPVQQEMDMMTSPMTERAYYLKSDRQISDFDHVKFTMLDDQGYGITGVYHHKTKQVIIQK